MAVATWPEAIGVVMKQPLEERAQELPKHLLGNPVADGGDPQRACLARPLGDVHASQGQGLESTPRLEITHQGEQILFEVSLEHSNADLVNPRCPAIPPDVAKSAVHEVRGDPSRQRMNFDLGHERSFQVEPRETDIPGSAWLPARGGRFLAAATLSDRGSDRPDRARHRRRTRPVVRQSRLPSHTDAPFTVGTPPATLEQLPSPKRRRWGRRTHRRMTRPFRDAYRSRLTLVWPGTAWDFHW